MSSFYRCGPPTMRCPHGHVGRVRLVPTPGPHTWLAVCATCQVIIKPVDKRTPIEPGRVQYEP